jgi:hypothetical protein
MKRTIRVAMGAIAILACATPAFADPSSTTIGITLNPVAGGYHESFNDKISPLLEASHRFSNFELLAYGLPPTAAIPYNDAIQSQTALRLTILDTTFRVWDLHGHFAIGIGETLYNQTTHYALGFGVNTPERQYSRIAGAHYEVAARMPFRAGAIETSLRYAPVLLGTQVTTYDNGMPSLFSPERGNQIDGDIRYTHRFANHTEAILGVRYLNFTAAYDVPLKPLSDRNVGVLPSIGYRWYLSR